MKAWVVVRVFAAILAVGGGFHGAQADSIRFARFEFEGKVSFGIVEGEKIHLLEGDPFTKYRKTGRETKLDAVKLLTPCVPTKIFGVAGNIPAATAEPKPKPAFPQFFNKVPSAALPHGGDIVLPKGATKVLYEAEVVAVIGKRARKVSVEEASDYILGVACGNDVSGTDWPDDFQLWRSKGSDTFAPFGPFIVTGLNLDDLEFELRLNGEVRQKTSTSKLVHSIPEMVSFISQYTTLEPGDIIYTGTEPPIDVLSPGDVVEVEVEGVGVLKNRVVAESN